MFVALSILSNGGLEMKNLVIVGNGFDIAHDLNTKYSDFIKYLTSYESKPEMIFPGFARLDSISIADRARHDLYEKLKKYIPEEDLWNSFEDALGYLDYDQVKEDNSCYMLGYGDDNWRDSANHDYQYMINEELSFMDAVENEFGNWINKIDTQISSLSNLVSIMNKNNIYLNFNYTDTLEHVYQIPETNIKYIHGKAKRGDKLILGHHDSSFWTKEQNYKSMSDEELEMYREYESERDFREVEAEQILEGYFQRTYKDTEQIIELNKDFFASISGVEKVFILGHSFSEIDFAYFVEVSNRVSSSCEWIMSWYSSEDFQNASNMIAALKVLNYKFIKI